jgi:hypothetical protein
LEGSQFKANLNQKKVNTTHFNQIKQLSVVICVYNPNYAGDIINRLKVPISKITKA